MSDQAPKEFTTKEEALQHIADIALAMKEGKPIQVFCVLSRQWNDCYGVHDLSSKPHLFRKKPEPREWWEVYNETRGFIASGAKFASKQDADKWREAHKISLHGNVLTIVKVKEEIE